MASAAAQQQRLSYVPPQEDIVSLIDISVHQLIDCLNVTSVIRFLTLIHSCVFRLRLQPYLDGLFALADSQRAGRIGGNAAVTFFQRSGLPMEVLKDVWAAADVPPSNFLDKPKFAVACRIIQLHQNGITPSGNIQQPANLRPAQFEGVSGTLVPFPVPPATASVQASPQSSPARPTPTTLAAQDPYTLTPQERGRYEILFKDYADAEGFVSGPTAVGLFGKSGLPQPQLAAIWTMVDTDPVDNKLDVLEFSMAMHLIVAATKKNLPVPPALPESLRQLKLQQRQTQQQPPAPAVVELPAPASVTVQPRASVVSGASMPPPPQHDGGPPQSIQIQPSSAASVLGTASVSEALPGPPPIQPPGGQSISDAFEGLSTTDTGMGYAESNPIQPSPSMDDSIPEPAPPVISQPTSMPQPATAAPVGATAAAAVTVAAKVSAPDTSGGSDIDQLRATIQKLQAENVSLKAQLSGMGDEEGAVKQSLGATLSEINQLTDELTQTRAQVLAAKSRLVEATAELQAAKEKKG